MGEIYFDNAATTRVDEAVADLMRDIMLQNYGNPSSLHSRGVRAQLALEHAKKQVMSAIGARGGKLYFTSGGTEANNLALFGAAEVKKRRGNRIIVSAVEHSSIIESAKELQKRGFEVIFLSPDESGVISPQIVANACDENTILVSVMLVNNEVGTVNPLKDIVKRVRERSSNAYIHTDAVQAFGKTPFSVSELGVDMLTVSGHKIHAPKGIGALYLADKVRVAPLLFGGEQQDKIRPGTENMPSIAALGLAAENAVKGLEKNAENAARVREVLIAGLGGIENAVINSPVSGGCEFMLNCSVLGYRSETLLHFLAAKEIYVSSGSACAKGAKSHVLSAMGRDAAAIDSALRISLSKYSTEQQAREFLSALKEAVATLRPAARN